MKKQQGIMASETRKSENNIVTKTNTHQEAASTNFVKAGPTVQRSDSRSGSATSR